VPIADLAPLFEPRGVVVLGASDNPAKLGYAMASSLQSFRGDLLLVNPRPTPRMFHDVEAAARSVDAVDLAVLCVPAAVAATALTECADAGVQAALVCAGGFAEAGGAGIGYADAVRDVVEETGLRLLGPNTSGFFVPATALCASFVPGARSLSAGSVAVVAASGGINHVLSFHLDTEGAGVSIGVGIGAGIDVTAADVLHHLVHHEQTRSVVLHVETVPDGRALLEAVTELAAVKPVVALVVGRNDVSEFAASHTGALATSWRATRAALLQAGAVLVDDEEQAVAAATALACLRPGRTAGIGLVTGQAGPGLVIADTLASRGHLLPRLQPGTVDAIGALLPPMTFQSNPVDTGRPGPTMPAILSAVAADPGVGTIGLYAITEPVVDLVDAMCSADLGDVSVVLGVDGPDAEVAAVRDAARTAGIALLRGPTRFAQGLAAVAESARRVDAGARVTAPSIPDAAGDWDEIRGKELLGRLDIPSTARERCTDRAAAHRALDRLGGPVAVKLVDATVLHKSDIGGVVLGVSGPQALDDALDQLELAGATEFLLERMAPSGIDLVVGARVDAVFGPIVVLGLGGVATEVLGDVAIRTAPLSVTEAAGMVGDLAGRRLLEGFRGGPTADFESLGRVVAMLGALVAAGQLAEIEINPLRVTEDGLLALDAVVRAHGEVEPR